MEKGKYKNSFYTGARELQRKTQLSQICEYSRVDFTLDMQRYCRVSLLLEISTFFWLVLVLAMVPENCTKQSVVYEEKYSNGLYKKNSALRRAVGHLSQTEDPILPIPSQEWQGR